jgi:hypothetical protein
MRIARQVFDYMLGTSKGTLRINDPGLAAELTQESIEGGRRCQVSQAAGKPELFVAKSSGEEAEKLAAEHLTKNRDRENLSRNLRQRTRALKPSSAPASLPPQPQGSSLFSWRF